MLSSLFLFCWYIHCLLFGLVLRIYSSLRLLSSLFLGLNPRLSYHSYYFPLFIIIIVSSLSISAMFIILSGAKNIFYVVRLYYHPFFFFVNIFTVYYFVRFYEYILSCDYIFILVSSLSIYSLFIILSGVKNIFFPL